MSIFIKPGDVRCRIAPSPTGAFHIGNVRTALFNFLFARKYGGKFILRIEDTDLERSDKKYEKEIIDSMAWLGLDYDEGPDVGGEFSPYRQSERIYVYSKYIKKLLDEDRAYFCFHSEKELEEEKKRFLEEKKTPIHRCSYRDWDRREAEKKTAETGNYIIRFKTPAGETIKYHDLIREDLSFDSGLLGDFSIAKTPATPLYNLAVVIDDFEMKINYVIRGEDHISNTPKQILLYNALGLPLPRFAHLPMVLGQDRSKLSKRHGPVSVSDYKKAGYLPEALINFLALLGWSPQGGKTTAEKEIFSKEELIEAFSIEKIQKSGAVFDIQKLDWMNGYYIRQKTIGELTELCLPYLEEAGFIQTQNEKRKMQNNPEADASHRYGAGNLKFKIGTEEIIDRDYIKKIIALEQPRLKKLSEIGERTDYFFKEPVFDKELLRWKNMSDKEIITSIDKIIKLVSNFPASAPPSIAEPSRRTGNASAFVKTTADKKALADKSAGKQLPISKDEISKVFLSKIGKGDKGEILWPLRVALTGKKASAGPFEIMEILGREKTIERLKWAKNLLKS